MRIQIANINIVAANTEYPFALPKNCMWFTLRERNGDEIRFAIEPNRVADKQKPYFTLLANAPPLQQRNLSIKIRQPMYFAAPNGGRVVEVLLGIEEDVSDAGE